MSTHARSLADRLAAASDEQLARLFRIRGVRADAPWDDFFDAAEQLLDPASIERGLAALSRNQARSLIAAVAGEADAAELALLADRGFVDSGGAVPAPVAAAVAAHGDMPSVDEEGETAASADAAARAAEQAFATAGLLADLLRAARVAPLALVATGALSASERRRFSADVDADRLRELAELAGLARAVDRELRVTAAADSWLASSFAERWAALAESFRAALEPGIRTDGGWLPMPMWPRAHPWDDAWPPRAQALLAQAVLLGLRAPDGTEPIWARRLRLGEAVSTAELQALLPTEVDRLFLQNDLTAIAPGPLLPALENRLRGMTEHEPGAQVSSYRFTADSVARALIEGETEQGILTFLHELSLTGVPQPLEYLVGQAAARHGLVRVGPDATGGTAVSSADEHLLQAIEVDRNLRPIGLVREGARLVSRVAAETVAWALADARYPATLVDRDGASVVTSRRRPAPSAPAEPEAYRTLLARMRSRQGPDADAAWLDRELESAVRARALVLIEVALPDGSSRELRLEASGMGGGRLRGRDHAADVERTLPVRSIRSVRVLGS
ncbi:helicase-associated domain-containing protein [Microbacterium sp. ARD32]|uniref:helicase-associated domain-containing protein n=1 Tax=Microbacterium sp. ARD32 TaxID=2962577 RepID=UPI002882876D|nr:helicase-associated domain-containing protein [Microbacterium sp. ARD32]MDT0158553.1 helicase-associated domain-containing protein [Microbacterium sp. ARD32]